MTFCPQKFFISSIFYLVGFLSIFYWCTILSSTLHFQGDNFNFCWVSYFVRGDFVFSLFCLVGFCPLTADDAYFWTETLKQFLKVSNWVVQIWQNFQFFQISQIVLGDLVFSLFCPVGFCPFTAVDDAYFWTESFEEVCQIFHRPCETRWRMKWQGPSRRERRKPRTRNSGWPMSAKHYN